jgi:hypothetical protein
MQQGREPLTSSRHCDGIIVYREEALEASESVSLLLWRGAEGSRPLGDFEAITHCGRRSALRAKSNCDLKSTPGTYVAKEAVSAPVIVVSRSSYFPRQRASSRCAARAA